MLNKFVDLFRCVILGCLGCVEQICGSIWMRYFGLLELCCGSIRMSYFRWFGLCWTNCWIYLDALFLVVWVVLNKSVDLFRRVIFSCLDCFEKIGGSIRMPYFGLFWLC